MNVSELYALTGWITNEIAAAHIPGKYKALLDILQQHTEPSGQRGPFEDEKNALMDAIGSVPLHGLTMDQLAFLSVLGIAEAVGAKGVEAIEDILFKNVLDVATSAQKLQQIHHAIQKGMDKADQIRAGLEGCVTREAYEEQDDVLIRVCFTGDASMANVVDFMNWGATWHDIGRGIAAAHNAAPEDVRVVGATRGSVVMELAVTSVIARTASSIILSAYRVAEKVLGLRKKAEEIQSMELSNTKLADVLKEEADSEKSAGIHAISDETIQGLEIKATEGDRIAAISVAVESLVSFLEAGGEIDFVIPDGSGGEEDASIGDEGLRATFQEIRRMGNRLKHIEPAAT